MSFGCLLGVFLGAPKRHPKDTQKFFFGQLLFAYPKKKKIFFRPGIGTSCTGKFKKRQNFDVLTIWGYTVCMLQWTTQETPKRHPNDTQKTPKKNFFLTTTFAKPKKKFFFFRPRIGTSCTGKFKKSQNFDVLTIWVYTICTATGVYYLSFSLANSFTKIKF